LSRWAGVVSLADNLRTVRMAQAQNGEGFAVLTSNPRFPTPVKLDLCLVETDQVSRSDLNALGGKQSLGSSSTTAAIRYSRRCWGASGRCWLPYGTTACRPRRQFTGSGWTALRRSAALLRSCRSGRYSPSCVALRWRLSPRHSLHTANCSQQQKLGVDVTVLHQLAPPLFGQVSETQNGQGFRLAAAEKHARNKSLS